uniref:Uncharacterized protein n=1 Tax=Megaselia scalaris TaxID=36166 RepID=T1GVE2_MEGSC
MIQHFGPFQASLARKKKGSRNRVNVKFEIKELENIEIKGPKNDQETNKLLYKISLVHPFAIR